MLPMTYLFLAMQSGLVVELLPVDEVLARFEEAIPGLKKFESELEAELGNLGPTESDWSESGLSISSAIQAEGKSTSEYALGEWELGGNAVLSRGDRPIGTPTDFFRYVVREYSGPIDYNSYHRVSGVPGQVVIHIIGTTRRIGNSECQNAEGIDLISSEEWRAWSAETMLVVFSLVRATRDDPREYCNLFRPNGKGGYQQFSYTSTGQPYISDNNAAQTFVVTALGEARKRLFENEIENGPQE